MKIYYNNSKDSNEYNKKYNKQYNKQYNDQDNYDFYNKNKCKDYVKKGFIK